MSEKRDDEENFIRKMWTLFITQEENFSSSSTVKKASFNNLIKNLSGFRLFDMYDLREKLSASKVQPSSNKIFPMNVSQVR